MENKKGVDRATIGLFWRATLVDKRRLILAFAYPLGAIVLSAIAPLFIGKALAALAIPGSDPVHYLIPFVIAVIIGAMLNRFGFAWALNLQARVMHDLQIQALNVLLRRSVGFHNNNIGGKLVSDAVDYPNAYAQLFGSTITNLIPFALVLIVGSVIVFFESWLLGLVITVMAAYALISGIHESNRRAPIRRRRQAAQKKVTGQIADVVLNVQTVKTFAREEREQAKTEELGGIVRSLRIRDWQQAANMGNNRMLILYLMQVAFVFFAIRLVQNDPSLLGIGIFAFSFTITITNRLFDVNIILRNVEEALLHAAPMTQTMQENPEIVDAPQAKDLEIKKGQVDLNNVTFRYEDSSSNQHVFSGLDLHIKPGEKIGLVGPSGSGKSTLTRLLLRFEDIDGGEITIDKQNIAKATQSSLREAIAFVPQEPLLFHRTIRENIAYGNDTATDEQIESASHSAFADQFISELPDGYDTIVGERGVKLSGGQRQRIAVARAILKDAPILVLDEATSALDSESEAYIQKALWKLMENRTALVIAHRLSTIQKMDRIIVLEDGKIVEQGSHAELIKQKGAYAKLWAHQSGGFLED
jgi:ATP-binding cassette, subfamily B, bacterial